VLCFDGDGAGIRAASRAADLALPHIRPGRSVSFALLPDGKDPDDLVRHDGRSPFDRVLSEAKPLAAMLWGRETASSAFDTPEKRAELENRLKQMVTVIADESVRRHYQQDMRDRLNKFFQPQFQGNNPQAGGFRRNAGGNNNRGQQRPGGSGSRMATGAISDRLMQSGLVRGHLAMPALRESVLAITIVNHPQLLLEEYDEIAAIDYENRDLQRLWSQVLTFAAETAADISRAGLIERLEAQGFDVLLKAMDQQVRNARLWTATEQAAPEDAREGYTQSLSLHKRTKALRWQKIELEREIAEATETGDEERIGQLMRALSEVQLEIGRMENQEAIIDGFGVMSGRVKGAAVGHS
jgi:DNA primase